MLKNQYPILDSTRTPLSRAIYYLVMGVVEIFRYHFRKIRDPPAVVHPPSPSEMAQNQAPPITLCKSDTLEIYPGKSRQEWASRGLALPGLTHQPHI